MRFLRSLYEPTCRITESASMTKMPPMNGSNSSCLIGTVAVMIKQELLLPFIGGIFVIEALSVILQVGSYKLRKKRIFKMAPIHHHFEQIGRASCREKVKI